MSNYTYLDNASPAYIDAMYEQYKQDPESVDPYWKKFFDGYEFALEMDDDGPKADNKEVAVVKLINAYRSRGHLIAETNPVRQRREHKSDLMLDYFGLTEADLEKTFDAGKEIRIGSATLSQILVHLKRTYCGSIGVEFMYCRDEQLRQWLYKEMEPCANRTDFSQDDQRIILDKINQAVMFENFLHTKYIGKKRFSLEGVDALIPALDVAIEESAKQGAKEFILGMAHRGRLNVLANIFGKPYEEIFMEFEGSSLPEDVKGDGDVKYHMGRSDDIKTHDGNDVHITLAANPSHLESVNPVVQGMAYSKQEEKYDGDQSKVIPILIHGDSAIAGQGVNYEVTNISKIDGFSVGGTVHIVTNNQLGFTTSYQEARSSVYCTDLAKVTESPVFHVNADDPEAVVRAVTMAIKIRMQFNIDVYVDILGYRRYGHNEGDEPRFTQPELYKRIDAHPNVQKIYTDKLLSLGQIDQDTVTEMQETVKTQLQNDYDKVKGNPKERELDYLKGIWKGIRPSNEEDFERSIQTGVKKATLNKIAAVLTAPPEGINMVPKAKRVIKSRVAHIDKKQVDWGLAELLAYGSLLLEGNNIRLIGQDAQRGTFSHRHAVFHDNEDEDKLSTPLNKIEDGQKEIEIRNSTLSEFCALGFEFGYSLSQPHSLVIWEAQFGDFCNGAQTIIDQYISSSESKWQRFSGLVMYLPHGYEGQGPEHSSARPERFLQLCAEHNMIVTNVTTPANLFHLIRRQMRNEFRVPLVLLTPKSLLRHPKVISPISELEKGCFKEIIDDEKADPKKVKKVVMCTGKVYYDLLQEQEEKGHTDTAVIRLEQIYPIPEKQLAAIKKRYKNAKKWLWVQEEPGNMGAWGHILRQLPEIDWQLVARKDSASPSTSVEKDHIEDQAEIVAKTFA